ncbi:hypothetical protein Tco_1558711, partial [Tanacetum coccineum]
QTGIALSGLPDPCFSLTSLAVFTLRISVVSSGRFAPVMMLPWLHYGSLRMGNVAAVRTSGCALFFSPQPIEYTTLLPWLGPSFVRAVGVLDSE